MPVCKICGKACDTNIQIGDNYLCNDCYAKVRAKVKEKNSAVSNSSPTTVTERGGSEKRKMLSWIGIMLIIFGVIIVVSNIISIRNGQNYSPSAGTSVSDAEPTKKPEPKKAAYEVTYQNARTYVDGIGTKWVQIIVEIENTGSGNLYLNSGSYDLEDSNGSLITSRSLVSTFPNVLAPGEKGYMYEETVLDDYDGDDELVLLPRLNVETAIVDLIRYIIPDVTVSNDSFGDVKVMGRIENQTDETADDMIYIVAFFYDKLGTPIGSAFTILSEEIAAGDKIGFEFTSFALPGDVTADAIADTVLYAYPVQLQIIF